MTTMMSRISALAAEDKHKGAYVVLATTGVLMAAVYYGDSTTSNKKEEEAAAQSQRILHFRRHGSGLLSGERQRSSGHH